MPESREKLAALYTHHRDHEPSGAFVNVMIDGETIIQYLYSGGGNHEVFNVAGMNDDPDTIDKLESYVNSDSNLEFSDERGIDISINGDTTTEMIVDYTDKFLSLVGHSVDDITFAEEEMCPTDGKMTWDEAAGTAGPKPVNDVDDVEHKVLTLYEYLKELDDTASGDIPFPYPEVNFYVGQEKLPFEVYPSGYSIVNVYYAERAAFEDLVGGMEKCDVTASDQKGVSVTAYNWSPEIAIEVTKTVFDELLDCDFSDITYAEVVQGEETRGWAEF